MNRSRAVSSVVCCLVLGLAAGCGRGDRAPTAPGGDKGGGTTGGLGGGEKTDPKVAKLTDAVKSGTPAEKAAALDELKKLGDAGRPAVAALCEQATSPEKAKRVEALESLEKLAPDLYDPVRKLVTTTDRDTHTAALGELGKLGPAARPAAPVVLWHLNQCAAVLRDTAKKKEPTAPEPFKFSAAYLYRSALDALVRVAPGEKAVVDVLLGGARTPAEGPSLFDGRDTLSIRLLGQTADGYPEHRAAIVTALTPVLDDADYRLAAVKAVAKCGPEAGKALPKLKELRLSESADVQKAADAAVAEVNGHLRAAEKLAALGAATDPKAAARAAADKDDRFLRQQAREQLRRVHPEVEKLAAALFEPPAKDEFGNEKPAPGLDTVKRAGTGGDVALVLVEQYVKRTPPYTDPEFLPPSERGKKDPWGGHRAAYAALLTLDPNSPAARKACLDVSRRYSDLRLKVKPTKEEEAEPQIWLAGELIRSNPDDKALFPFLKEVVTAHITGPRPRYDEAPVDAPAVYFRRKAMIDTAVADLGKLATLRPALRGEIVPVLMLQMSDDEWFPDLDEATFVRSRPLVNAFLACGPAAAPALKGLKRTKSNWKAHNFAERVLNAIEEQEKEAGKKDKK